MTVKLCPVYYSVKNETRLTAGIFFFMLWRTSSYDFSY